MFNYITDEGLFMLSAMVVSDQSNLALPNGVNIHTQKGIRKRNIWMAGIPPGTAPKRNRPKLDKYFY